MSKKKSNSPDPKKAKAVKRPIVSALETVVKSIKRQTSEPDVDVSLDNITFVFDKRDTENLVTTGTEPRRRWVCRYKNGRLVCGWE
jgi:hypothetical protein